MPKTKKVILYGGSLFIAGLDASLSAIPGLDIQRVEAYAGNDLEQVRAYEPDVIVVELGVASKNMTLTLLQRFPGVTLIGLDPESDRLLVLSVQHQTALAAADLVKVIQAPHPPEED
jgi:hypothetical protein